MIYFYILAALFIADALLTYKLVKTGNFAEGNPLVRLALGRFPDARSLIAFTVVKTGLFGYLFMLTEGAERFHFGLVIGAALVVGWNIRQLATSE